MERKYSLQQWEQMLNDYEKSDLTVRQWCQSQGIAKSAFYYWMKRIKQNNNSIEANTQWATLSMPVHSPDKEPIILKYKDFSIEITDGYDKDLLTDVIAVVMQLC